MTRAGWLSSHTVLPLTGVAIVMVAIGFARAAEPLPTDKLPYGFMSNMYLSIVERRGIDTEAASLRIDHTRSDAEIYCKGIGESLPECIERILDKVRVKDVVTANCRSGQFTDVFGNRFNIADGLPPPDLDYRITDLSTSRDLVLDFDFSSRAAVIEQLCPARISELKKANEALVASASADQGEDHGVWPYPHVDGACTSAGDPCVEGIAAPCKIDPTIPCEEDHVIQAEEGEGGQAADVFSASMISVRCLVGPEHRTGYHQNPFGADRAFDTSLQIWNILYDGQSAWVNGKKVPFGQDPVAPQILSFRLIDINAPDANSPVFQYLKPEEREALAQMPQALERFYGKSIVTRRRLSIRIDTAQAFFHDVVDGEVQNPIEANCRSS